MIPSFGGFTLTEHEKVPRLLMLARLEQKAPSGCPPPRAQPIPKMRALPHLSLGWRRVLVAASVVALVGFVLSSESAHAALLRALDNVQQTTAAQPHLAAVLVVLFTGIAATLAFVSSWLVIPFAVHTWGTSRALLLVWAGWLLGGAASYAIGRCLGAPVVRWLGFSRLLARYEERVSHRTPFTLAFLFQLALPSELRGYLFGLGRYPFGRYILSLALAELPFGIASVYLGAGIVQRRATLVLVMGLGLLLMSAWSLYVLHRHLTGPRVVLEPQVVPAARPPSA